MWILYGAWSPKNSGGMLSYAVRARLGNRAAEEQTLIQQQKHLTHFLLSFEKALSSRSFEVRRFAAALLAGMLFIDRNTGGGH